MLMKRQEGSSRKYFTTSTIFSARTVTVSWLKATECPLAAPGSALTIVWPKASSLPSSILTKPSAFDGADAADLLLQQQHAVEQRLRRRRAARHVDVDRHDAVATAHHRIGIVVVAAAIGAGAHRDHVARLGHLVVDLAQRRRHLVGERAGHDHHVGLPRRGTRGKAEALDVIARHRDLHHLDGAARQTKRHPHQRARACPGDEVIGRRNEEALVRELVIDLAEIGVVGADRLAGCGIQNALGSRGDRRPCRRRRAQSHSSAPFFHSYSKPTVSTARNPTIDQKPVAPSLPNATAHGNRNATSRSKMMKRIATDRKSTRLNSSHSQISYA